MVNLTDNRKSEQGQGVTPDPTPDQPTCKEVDVAPSKHTKSPAFQFYPRDFLSSRKVDRMSMTERGVYITLLSHCWIDHGLPTDLGELAAACRMKLAQFERIWSRGVLSQCFELRGVRYVNPRLEVEWRVQAEYSRKQREKAEKRWGADAAALPAQGRGNAPIPSHPFPSHSIPKDTESPEPSNGSGPLMCSSPTVLEFPVVGPDGPTWGLTEAHIAEWSGLFPTLDVGQDARHALAWVLADLGRRKTARGMPRFLVGWFTRTVDRGAGNGHGRGAASPAVRAVGPAAEAVLREMTRERR